MFRTNKTRTKSGSKTPTSKRHISSSKRQSTSSSQQLTILSSTTRSTPTSFSSFPVAHTSRRQVTTTVHTSRSVDVASRRSFTSTSNTSDAQTIPEFNSNITPAIESKIGRNLHRQEHHPICTIKDLIFDHFKQNYKDEDGKPLFQTFDNFHPEVTTKANFDELLVPADHPSRAITDTFYRTPELILRPHTSAHQTELLRRNIQAFLVAGDCYRRDEIDSSHYPVFHQMEGVRVFDPEKIPQDPVKATEYVVADLKQALEGVAKKIFGQDAETRWIDAYFPFTHPSFELEVQFNGKWLEVLGCGVTQQKIMDISGVGHKKAWAFGLGLDRLAMVLFEVPDIRLFWSEDERFAKQFHAGEITKFKPYSKYPGTFRDVSFWYNPEQFHDNDFFALVREFAGDCVDNVELVDAFVHPKTQRNSKLFRVHYRSLDRTLTTEEVNAWQEQLRESIAALPSIELR